MNLSHAQRQAKLRELCDIEGFQSIEAMLEAAVVDSVSPAICVVCGYTAEMEPDQSRGWCEECGTNTVVSALVLAGVI